MLITLDKCHVKLILDKPKDYEFQKPDCLGLLRELPFIKNFIPENRNPKERFSIPDTMPRLVISGIEYLPKDEKFDLQVDDYMYKEVFVFECTYDTEKSISSYECICYFDLFLTN